MTTKIPVELSSTPGIADSSNATAITIDSSENTTFSGDVEVGTTAPKINLKNTDTSIVADQSLGVIEIESTDGSTGSAGTIAKLDIAASGAFDGSGHGSDFRFTTGATNQSGSIALTEVMRITSTASVGIGTTSPSRQLHLNNASDHGIMAITGSTSSLAGVVFGDTADDDVSSIIHNNSSNYLYLSTSSTERMRIASNGNVMVGTTSSSGTTKLTVVQPDNDDPVARFTMSAAANAVRGFEITTTNTVNAANKFFLQGDDNGTTRIELRTNGDIYRTGSTTSSDERLKENIVDTDPKLHKLKEVRVVDFNWKPEANRDEERHRGVIAQELETIFPELVTQPNEYKEAYYERFIPILIKSIQELNEKIERLENGN